MIKEKVYDPKQDQVVEKEHERLIFPRFHQLDVVRNVLQAAKAEGVGHSYLVQHSAGSGKSNSIAWLSHQLAKLYRSEGDKERLFDSIIVVTDRRVLDQQLQQTIKQFEQTTGVVMPLRSPAHNSKKPSKKAKTSSSPRYRNSPLSPKP